MKEELFVLTPDGFERLDLNEPSGIQLNYKSNLFGDLSKVTCSYSYTFKLPMTVNNRRVLDFAEDIRHQSSMIRKRLTASYMQNGINLFSNANLYIESVGSCYNAVMTWDVIKGMTKLNDNDISLRALPNPNKETMFGGVTPQTEDEAFDNNELVLHPLYNCGIPYYRWNLPYAKSSADLGDGNHRVSITRSTGFASYPMPVVPVYRILQMINNHFGTKFNLGRSIGIGQAKQFDPKREVVEKGVVPLISKDLNYEERLQRKCYLSGIKRTYVNATIKEENDLYIPDMINFASTVVGLPDDYLDVGSFRVARHDASGTTYARAGIEPKIKNIAVEFDGCLQVAFTDFTINTNSDEVPVLSLYQRQQVFKDGGAGARGSVRQYYEWVELDSIEGEVVTTYGGYKIFEFDFAQENGSSRLSCENLKVNGEAVIFVFSHRIYNFYTVQKDIEVYLLNSASCRAAHSIDVVSNLPDIGCLNFVKSLFYMMGAFPYINTNQEIVPKFFSEIKDNLLSGNVKDWSSKLPGAASELPSEIKFAMTDFAQSNHYMMKSDDLESEYNPEELDDDVYASGVGTISVDNSTLDLDKTIIQLPFFPPYILNRKHPSYQTGDTMKCWTLADEAETNERNTVYNRLEYCDPNPAIGIIKDKDITQELNTGEIVVKDKAMTMEVWNQFASIRSNESYAYLQEILRKPFIIKETLRLDEFDLLDLDYTRPIYLDKYNSYFAIISILRDSKGICNCELIKLP